MRIRARTNARSRISSVRRPEIASDACRHGSGCCARQFCESESSSLSEKRIHRAHNSALRWGAEPSSPREGDGSLPIRLPDRLAIPFLEPQPQPQQEGEEGEAAQEGQEGPKAPIRLSDRLRSRSSSRSRSRSRRERRGTGGTRGTERPKHRKHQSIGSGRRSDSSSGAGAGAGAGRGKKIADDLGHDRARQAREVQDPIPRARRIAHGTPQPRISRDDDRSFGRAGDDRGEGEDRWRGGEGDQGRTVGPPRRGYNRDAYDRVPRGAPPNSTEEGT